jgi:hypothetical protein
VGLRHLVGHAGDPLVEGNVEITACLEHLKEDKILGTRVFDVVARHLWDKADVVCVEVHGAGVAFSVDDGHASLALDPVLPLADVRVPVQLADGSGLESNLGRRDVCGLGGGKFALGYLMGPAAGFEPFGGYLGQVYQISPEIAVVARLAKDFFHIIRQRDVTALQPWFEAANMTTLAGFARHLVRDKDAVEEALKLPWSQGQVEGQVHRLKLIKRQMYGRAGFDLLRLRVLQKT